MNDQLLASIYDMTDRVNIARTATVDIYIRRAQERYIRGMLGATLYSELVAADLSSLTDRLQSLYNAVNKALVYRAYAYYLAESTSEVTVKGARTPNSEISEAASAQKLSKLVSNAESDAEWWERELYNLLDRNRDTYSTWDTQPSPRVTQGFARVGRRAKQTRRSRGNIPYYNSDQDDLGYDGPII